ncbi:hypothetical protein ACIBCN_24835 [Nocardia sp. NPDC051052]|uniref:hypothetical protein n=1 Tax=Nocardia sp. NPDC051052 TaxID=3364322 RepID=UPI0037AC7A06
MGYRTVATAAAAAATYCALFSPTAGAEPPDPAVVPPRTAISIRSTLGAHWSTANEHESRTSLSLTKLYLADYALRHGDGSRADRDLAERMIRYSDDGAATTMESKYPQALKSVAAEYHLADTHAAGGWGAAYTSTADLTDFLDAKLRTDPNSPILEWMAEAGENATDGTEQDWGTARVPFVVGTKWGWSDFGEPDVASASYGPGFAVAAHTHGTATEQTLDILGALPLATLELITGH